MLLRWRLCFRNELLFCRSTRGRILGGVLAILGVLGLALYSFQVISRPSLTFHRHFSSLKAVRDDRANLAGDKVQNNCDTSNPTRQYCPQPDTVDRDLGVPWIDEVDFEDEAYWPDMARPLHRAANRAVGKKREKAMTMPNKEKEDLPIKGSSKIKKTQWSKADGIRLVVVEEHHDVIAHWYAAVELGLLPPRGNVLLHLDAHSDISLPFINGFFPLFRYPKRTELVYLMQRNDMFISGAALSGLFNRYIWVVPPWDPRLEDFVGPAGYNHYHVLLGIQEETNNPEMGKNTTKPSHEWEYHRHYTGRRRLEEADYTRLCYCINNTTLENHNSSSSECFLHTNRNSQNPLGVSKLISTKRCQPRYHILVEAMAEKRAIELLKTNERPNSDYQQSGAVNGPEPGPVKTMFPLLQGNSDWLSEDESIILDIDEDYYGVEPAVVPLEEVGLAHFVVDAVSDSISKIFCPQNAQQEAIADSVFGLFLDDLSKCLLPCEKGPTHTCNLTEMQEIFSREFTRDLKHSPISKLICGKNSEDAVKSLVVKLLSLEGRQLPPLRKVGICLRGSPNTLGFDPMAGMIVCTGRNRPNNSVVTFHVPDEAEIADRSRALSSLFHAYARILTPKIITIARSVRDGYTPRGSFAKIEKDLVHILQKVYPQLTQATIIYDLNLLGGKLGWADRTRRKLDNFGHKAWSNRNRKQQCRASLRQN